ncbi:DNA-directed DNA polymerase epsilon, subunit C [Scheffersomyces xylosifermentans]|uniref:DNA-directed DNA polymerase epsilon, subunit C n=1 Tax=Scheffersomyces xylosifermentans TaxID=1304137 RepID=UPI00315DAC3C
MSSPVEEVHAMDSSQAENSGADQTPTTTPPPPHSTTATPTADVEMEDAETNEDAEKEEKEETEHADGDDEEEQEQLLALPLAKIKRIFKMDPDYVSASQSAVYATGLATELFIQYFVEQASLLAKIDKRKKIQYKDFSGAVASHDSLTFLNDTVPKTQPLSELIQSKQINITENTTTSNGEAEAVVANEPEPKAPVQVPVAAPVKSKPLSKGQQTLKFPVATEKPFKKAVIHDLVLNDDDNQKGDDDDDVVMVN